MPNNEQKSRRKTTTNKAIQDFATGVGLPLSTIEGLPSQFGSILERIRFAPRPSVTARKEIERWKVTPSKPATIRDYNSLVEENWPIPLEFKPVVRMAQAKLRAGKLTRKEIADIRLLLKKAYRPKVTPDYVIDA